MNHTQRLGVFSWNVQRLGETSSKAGKIDYINKVMKNALANGALVVDCVFLCEVTQTGGEVVKRLNTEFDKYDWEFVEIGSKNDAVSPCSYVVGFLRSNGLSPGVESVGVDQKRAYLDVSLTISGRKMLLGLVHARAAGYDLTKDELFTDISNLANSKSERPLGLIGDLNVQPARAKEYLDANKVYFAGLAWKGLWSVVASGSPTFKSKAGATSELDYCFSAPEVKATVSIGMDASTAEWDLVDHLPIVVELNWVP